MRSLVLIALAFAAAPAESNPLLARTFQDNPPVQIWLNKSENIDYGEAVRVYVRSQYDGHIVVLHADPEGRVRVLYPVDPVTDDFIRGGRAYEIRNRQDDEAFRATDQSGLGVIYVAYSQDPFRYANFARDDHWDAAHTIVQGIDSTDSYWIHAYLHRKEGDLSNSGCWYNRADKPMPDYARDEEWQELHDYITSKG